MVCRVPQLGWLDGLLAGPGLRGLQEDHGGECCVHPVTPQPANTARHAGAGPDHLGGRLSVRPRHSNGARFFPFHTGLFGRKPLCAAHTSKKGPSSPPHTPQELRRADLLQRRPQEHRGPRAARSWDPQEEAGAGTGGQGPAGTLAGAQRGRRGAGAQSASPGGTWEVSV